jgi:hypothetical protein
LTRRRADLPGRYRPRQRRHEQQDRHEIAVGGGAHRRPLAQGAQPGHRISEHRRVAAPGHPGPGLQPQRQLPLYPGQGRHLTQPGPGLANEVVDPGRRRAERRGRDPRQHHGPLRPVGDRRQALFEVPQRDPPVDRALRDREFGEQPAPAEALGRAAQQGVAEVPGRRLLVAADQCPFGRRLEDVVGPRPARRRGFEQVRGHPFDRLAVGVQQFGHPPLCPAVLVWVHVLLDELGDALP